MDKQYEIKSFDKIVDVLSCFSEQMPELRMMDIQGMTGINKSSLYRILVNLEAVDMVAQDPTTGKYRLGTRFLQYSKICLQGLPFTNIAKQQAMELVAATKETVLINVAQRDQAVSIVKIDSPQPINLTIGLGRTIPLLAGASAKALIIDYPKEKIWELYKKDKWNFTLDELFVQLDKIRKDGVAYTISEHDSDVYGIASPIRDDTKKIIADVAILGPSIRIDEDKAIKYANLCRDCAAKISKMLGYYE